MGSGFRHRFVPPVAPWTARPGTRAPRYPPRGSARGGLRHTRQGEKHRRYLEVYATLTLLKRLECAFGKSGDLVDGPCAEEQHYQAIYAEGDAGAVAESEGQCG